MALGITNSLSAWTFQDTHIERNLDSSAYEAAHPDDTLVLAGPPRFSNFSGTSNWQSLDETNAANLLLPIGMVQQISFQQGKPTQPLMAVGSGRSFFTSGKAQTSWSAARLLVSGRNLLRVLHNTAISKRGIDPSKMDDPAAKAANDKFLINLDSELYYLPFGMMCLFKNKAHDFLGAFYVEMCMIASWSATISAGTSQIMESVQGVADRILPISITNTIAAATTGNRQAMDKIIGFTTGTDDESADVLDGRNNGTTIT